MNRILQAALVSALVLVVGVSQSFAQLETVVVTGSRRSDYEAPHVSITKRADHLITKVRVTCDTRELSKRRDELKATLRNMIREAAQTKTLSLGLGDEILGDLNEENFDDIIVPDARADTSQAFVIVKTTLSKADTFNSATARIKEFLDNVPKVGRTEVLREDRWDLTLIGPEQYRDTLIGQIVSSANHTAQLFGPGYGVTIEGLEHTVSWYQKGPLDLALYIPYSLHISPLSAK
jgi:hypothetical protein